MAETAISRRTAMMVTTAPCAAAAQLTSGVFAIPSSDTNSLLSFDGLPPEKAHWITNAKLMDPDKAVCRVERWPPACLVDRLWGGMAAHAWSPPDVTEHRPLRLKE
jgi:hypothetical protein